MAIAPNKNLEIISAQEKVRSKKDQMLENIKMLMLQDLKLDDKLIKRSFVMEEILKAREDKEFPTLIHFGGNTVKIGEKKKYPLRVEKYKNAAGNEDALKKLDKELAEEIILDYGNMIKFSSTEKFESKTAEEEARTSFERLNKDAKYEKKIELIKKIDGEETHFVIKRTEEQIKELERAEKAYENTHGTEEKTEEKPVVKPIAEPVEEELVKKEPVEEEPEEESNEVELTATISDTTQISRAIAERRAGEKLREKYKNTARYKPRSWPTKAALFLGRGYMKDHYTRKFMDKNEGMQRDAKTVSAADRHEMEEGNRFNEAIQNIGNIDQENYPRTYEAIDEIAKKITGDANDLPPREKGLDDKRFQEQFTAIIKRNFDVHKPATATDPNRKPIEEILKDNDIQQMSSNITLKLNAFRDHQRMTWDIAEHVTKNPTEENDKFNVFSRKKIVEYFEKYQKNPEFLKTLNIRLDDKNAMQELRRLQAHQGALTQIAAQTMKLKVQILVKGEEAYDVKQEGNVMTKIGNRLDKPISNKSRFGKWLEKHPFAKNAFGTLRGITKLGAMITPAILLAPLGPLAIASGVGGMAFTKTLFKKYAHYNKEHIGYQRNQAVNLFQNNQERERLMNEIGKMNPAKRFMLYYFGLGKTARDVRQFSDYVMTTHDQLENSSSLAGKLEGLLKKPQLSKQEQEVLENYISEGLARLDYHKRTGQNFLGSDDKDVAEKEYQNIYRLVLTGSMRLDKDLDDIRENNYYYSEMDIINNGTGDKPNQIGYQKSRKRFKYRQTEKALLGAVKAGGVAFGLSYLATSLASTKASTQTISDKKYVVDDFMLGKHQLTGDNHVYIDSKGFFQNPHAAHQTISFDYGGGTDATPVVSGHLTQAEYLSKVNEVQDNILHMNNLSTITKTDLINQLHQRPREHVRAQKGFTNDYLQGMRCTEILEQTAKGLNDSGVNAGNITIHAAYNGSVYDVVGHTYNNAGERIAQGGLEYAQTLVTPEHIIPIPIPGFMNTFKEEGPMTNNQGLITNDYKGRKTRTPAPKVNKSSINKSSRRRTEDVDETRFTNANN